MNGKKNPTARSSDKDLAPDLSADGWPEKLARATVRHGCTCRKSRDAGGVRKDASATTSGRTERAERGRSRPHGRR